MPEIPSDAEVVADLMQPLMAYAALLEKAGNPSQSKLVWALLEDHYRKLTALLEQVRQQAPDVALETPRWTREPSDTGAKQTIPTGMMLVGIFCFFI